MNYKIKPIRTEEDYKAALKVLEPLFDNEPEIGTQEGDFMDVMITLVSKYEDDNFKIDPPPTPIEAIKFRMAERGLQASDLAKVIGTRSRVYEILNGTRKLSKLQIKRLNYALDIPIEWLMSDIDDGYEKDPQLVKGKLIYQSA